MTKKDYIIIARAIVEAKIWAGTDQKSGVTLTSQYISDALQKDNPKFDAEKFAEACGLLKVVNECKYCERLDACEGIKCACDCHT